MKVNTDYQKRCSNPYFGIKVSKNFIDVAHNHYNYQVGTYKKQNIYRFNEKIKEFEDFGYDDYTINYERKLKYGNWKHYLVITKDGTNNQRRVLLKRNTLFRIIEEFLSMDKNEFQKNFHRHK